MCNVKFNYKIERKARDFKLDEIFVLEVVVTLVSHLYFSYYFSFTYYNIYSIISTITARPVCPGS